MGGEGLVLACALLQGRGWLGQRHYPARSTLQRFEKQGDSPCTPGGGCAPCTPLGGRETLPPTGYASLWALATEYHSVPGGL